MEDGPFKSAVEALQDNIIKEVYITYKVKDGYLEKTTSTRDHKMKDSDYHDITSTERLIKVENK